MNYNDRVTKEYVEGLLAGAPKVVFGSYVGTGTYGQNNPCSLTFGFTPKVLVFLTNNAYVYTLYTNAASPTATFIRWGVTAGFYEGTYAESGKNHLTYSGNTVSWYNPQAVDGSDQRNVTGTVYHYFAIG